MDTREHFIFQIFLGCEYFGLILYLWIRKNNHRSTETELKILQDYHLNTSLCWIKIFELLRQIHSTEKNQVEKLNSKTILNIS